MYLAVNHSYIEMCSPRRIEYYTIARLCHWIITAHLEYTLPVSRCTYIDNILLTVNRLKTRVQQLNYYRSLPTSLYNTDVSDDS